MSSFRLRKILVAVAEPRRRSNKALRRAAELARRTGARLELLHSKRPREVLAWISPARAADLEGVAAAQARAALERLARPLRAEGIAVDTAVVTGSAPYEGIMRRARAGRADLIVIESRRHNEFARALLDQTDFELIRHSRLPVLIVKGSRRWRRPRVLAALDPFHSHDKPASLDARIVAAGQSLANTLGGTLHVAHVWWPLAEALPGAVIDTGALSITATEVGSYERALRRAFYAAVRDHGIAARHRHLRRGDPSIELPSLARSVGASLIVMGAVSRSALRRLVIGETAERVLDRLRCDVLIVKTARLPRRA